MGSRPMGSRLTGSRLTGSRKLRTPGDSRDQWPEGALKAGTGWTMAGQPGDPVSAVYSPTAAVQHSGTLPGGQVPKAAGEACIAVIPLRSAHAGGG
jgi:hypothetical protein